MGYYFKIFILSILIITTYGLLEKEWKKFKQDYNKTYYSHKEEKLRFKIFKENWNKINKHNQRFEQGLETYLEEINRFADLTDEEFTKVYGLDENEWVVNLTGTALAKHPDYDYFDWREIGAVTPVKDQGHCGSCWIFSAIGVLESYNYLKTGKLKPLSEQYVVDCYSNSSCEGGDPSLALEFLKSNGTHLEEDYPYNAKQNECKNSTKPLLPSSFSTIEYLNTTDHDLKIALKSKGPISVCLYVTYRWRFYKSGVWYKNECSEVSNHCVLLVGYGTENGNDYWLFKNSWGPLWGLNGYIKVARNKHLNYCGINAGCTYLV